MRKWGEMVPFKQRQHLCTFIKLSRRRKPQGTSRATPNQDQASVGRPALLHPDLRSRWSHGWKGSSFGWCSVWWSAPHLGSQKCLWCNSSPEKKRWEGEMFPNPAVRLFSLRTKLSLICCIGPFLTSHIQHLLSNSTYEILHHLRIISMKDRCSKPADVKLDISLCSLNVLLVSDVHRLSPVPGQCNTHHT